jgi:phosphate starvation-inducible PhoH-like protein
MSESTKKENKERRVPKGEPKLDIELNEEQKKVKADFYKHDVSFILGDFGSGKTLVATAIALSAYRKRQYNKIIIARPITKNKLGFLPGDVNEKMAVWIAPIVHNFEMCQSKASTTKMMNTGEVEILPIDFAKGITYTDAVVIIDEFQDMVYDEFRTMLTRLGKDSKLIFTGSKEQVDKSIGRNSCINEVMKLKDSGLVAFNELKANHRNQSLTHIGNYLEG